MQSIKDLERVVPADEHCTLVNDLAGAWRGRLIDDTGRAESFNLHRDDADHRLPGQFHLFSTPDGLVAGARLLEASERSCVVLVGPYLDPATQLTVVTLLEACHEPGWMEGTFCTRHHGDRTVVRTGRFTATHGETVTRAA